MVVGCSRSLPPWCGRFTYPSAGTGTTLGELQHVYEATWGCRLERANFRRKVLATPGFVIATKQRRVGDAGGAPATVYRAGGGSTLVPPLMRPNA